MQIDTQAQSIGGQATSVRLLSTPDQCPLCHRTVHSIHSLTTFLHGRFLCQAVFRCTNQKCQELFIGTYRSTPSTGAPPGFALVAVAPRNAKGIFFPESIHKISPTFVDIYNQAIIAESYDLSQLVGIGLRKSLEFLIKDFAVSENPDKEAEIWNTQLGNCISNYLRDQNIKDCAKRAAWLGNDETHYTRKWETKDINDLKVLVQLTVNWIDNVMLTKKYLAEMP